MSSAIAITLWAGPYWTLKEPRLTVNTGYRGGGAPGGSERGTTSIAIGR